MGFMLLLKKSGEALFVTEQCHDAIVGHHGRKYSGAPKNVGLHERDNYSTGYMTCRYIDL